MFLNPWNLLLFPTGWGLFHGFGRILHAAHRQGLLGIFVVVFLEEAGRVSGALRMEATLLGKTKTWGTNLFFHIFHGLSSVSFPIICKMVSFFQVYAVYIKEFSIFPAEYLGKEHIHFSMFKADFKKEECFSNHQSNIANRLNTFEQRVLWCEIS